MRRLHMFAGLFGLLACVADDQADDQADADEQADTAGPMPSPGDPCGWEGALCVDEDDLIECLDRRWTQQSCTDFCATLGPGVSSPGCNLEAGAIPVQLCACEPPADGCHPGQGQCLDDDTLRACGDDWTWTPYSCADVCANQSLLPLGCDAIGDKAICMCTTIGTPCVDEEPLCASPTKLATCEAGVWVEIDCSELCGPDATCDPGASAPAACAC